MSNASSINKIPSSAQAFKYSELDGSNDRFMRKQKNTNQLSDPIFDKLFSNDTDADNNEENTLF